MRAPAVSGAQIYQELCLATHNKEKRLTELWKRQQYQKASPSMGSLRPNQRPADSRSTELTPSRHNLQSCGDATCATRQATWPTSAPSESRGQKDPMDPQASTKQVTSKQQSSLLDLLFSSDEESDAGVSTVRVQDKGSQPQCARVEIQGVPVYGMIDSGADITILGGNLLCKVVTTVKLRKKDLKPADKVPRITTSG